MEGNNLKKNLNAGPESFCSAFPREIAGMDTNVNPRVTEAGRNENS